MRGYLSITICLSLLGWAASAGTETAARSEADRQYAFAQGLYQQGLFDLAAEEFAKFAEDYPEDSRREAAIFYAAQSLFQSERGRREATLAAVQKYQSAYSGSQSRFYYMSFYLVGEIYFQRAEAGVVEEGADGKGALPIEVQKAYADALAAYLRCAEISGERSETVSTALYRAAYCATKLERWEQAAKAYERLAGQYQSVRAQFMAGEMLYRHGETNAETLSEAMKAYEKVALFGDNAFEDDAAVAVGWCLFKQGKLQDCHGYLKERVDEGLFARVDRDFQQEKSKLPEAYYLLGVCSRGLGDNAGAVMWMRLLSRHTESPFRREGLAVLGELLGENVDLSTEEGAEIVYTLGQKSMEAGRGAEGVRQLERVYRTYPRMATAPFREPLLCDWGQCYDRLGYHREALAILGYLSQRASNAAMRARAARAQALCHQGLARETEDPDQQRSEELEAMAALKRSADNSVGREGEEALSNVGDFYFAREMYGRASMVYEELLSRFPQSTRRGRVLFRLGQCALKATRSGGTQKAISFFERCRREFPSGVDAVFATEQLAALFARMSRHESALVEYSRLQADNFPSLSGKDKVACEGVFENAAYARGLIRQRVGDIEGAMSEMELFLFQHPASEKAGQTRLRLSRLYLEQGQPQAAVRAVSPCLEAPERCPDVETAVVMLAQSLVALGRPTEAMERVEDVLRSPAGAALSPSVFFRVSAIMEKQGDISGARRPYQLLIERYGELSSGMIAAASNTREMVNKEEYAKAVHYCSDLFAIHAPERATGWAGDTAGPGKTTREAALRCLHGLEVIRSEARATVRTAFWELGKLNLRLEEPAAAARAFESLASIKPPTKQHFDVLFEAGSAWKKAGEFQKALEDFEEIVRSARDASASLRAQLAIGTMWLEAGDARRSLGSFLRIVNFYDAEDTEVRPWVGRALFQSGVAFERLGNTKDAKRQFEVFVRDFGKEERLESLRKEAERRLGQMKQEVRASSLHPEKTAPEVR